MAGESAVTAELCRALEIRRGVTAVIGSGGKTGLLARLCRELPGTVILCTSTRIYPFDGVPLVTGPVETLPYDRFCAGTWAENGKLAAPQQSFEELSRLADYVLVEADGSRGLPFKAHLAHEPVIPACADQTVQVVGTWALGRPVGEAVHRPERFIELCGGTVETPVTPEMAAKVLNAEALCGRVLLNGPDGAGSRRLAELLDVPAIIFNVLE